jgi:hypothetical protein
VGGGHAVVDEGAHHLPLLKAAYFVPASSCLSTLTDSSDDRLMRAYSTQDLVVAMIYNRTPGLPVG